MARAIVNTAAERAGTDPADGYKERLLKYIPAEVITLYMFLDGVVGAATAAETHKIAQWTIFVIGLIATPAYLYVIGKVTKRTQLIISTLAFFVWVFALGGPFVQVIEAADLKLWGAILLGTYTFGVALIKP